MKARKVLLTLSLAAVLVAGGLVVASNMGFKYVANFSIAGQDYWVSFPYNNQYTNANDICTDVGANASLVSRFDPGTSSRADWTCPFGNNFTVTAAEGYFLRVSTASTPVIVGSHDPTLTVPVGGWVAAGVDHIVGIPYHTTATVANDICAEVGAAATLVSRFDTPTASRADWTCPFGNNFPVSIGEAYAVRVNAAGGNFTPSHY